MVQDQRHSYYHRLKVCFLDCSSPNKLISCSNSGMTPIIRVVLSNLIGDDAKDIDIISNDVILHDDGKWEIQYRHPSR